MFRVTAFGAGATLSGECQVSDAAPDFRLKLYALPECRVINEVCPTSPCRRHELHVVN